MPLTPEQLWEFRSHHTLFPPPPPSPSYESKTETSLTSVLPPENIPQVRVEVKRAGTPSPRTTRKSCHSWSLETPT